MKAIVYNQEGKETGEALLPKEIFDVKIVSDLIHQVAVSQMANRRQVIADTKDRGDVRGGGRKPWRQKGTGRARHGSRRSPLWKGGGVTFGPTKERNFAKKINKKTKRLALFSVLSKKFEDQEIKVVDEIKLNEAKTRIMAKILGKFFPQKKNAGLVILPKSHNELIRATRNLPFAQITTVSSLNLEDVLKYKYLLFFKNAISLIKEIYKV